MAGPQSMPWGIGQGVVKRSEGITWEPQTRGDDRETRQRHRAGVGAAATAQLAPRVTSWPLQESLGQGTARFFHCQFLHSGIECFRGVVAVTMQRRERWEAEALA